MLKSQLKVSTSPYPISVTLVRDCSVVAKADGSEEVAYLDTREAKILHTLEADRDIRLQAFVDSSAPNLATFRNSQNPGMKRKGNWTDSLSVNIYGTSELFDRIGMFATQCNLFIQDPRHCDRNVEYRNPHRMPFEEAVHTGSLQIMGTQSVSSNVEVRKPMDLFRDFGLDEELTETDSSPLLKTKLQP